MKKNCNTYNNCMNMNLWITKYNVGKLECIDLTRYVADNFVNLNKWDFKKLLATMREFITIVRFHKLAFYYEE